MTEEEVYLELRQVAKLWVRWNFDPEDLAHDTFLKYLGQHYQPGEVTSGYLRVLTRHTVYDQLRRRTTNKRGSGNQVISLNQEVLNPYEASSATELGYYLGREEPGYQRVLDELDLTEVLRLVPEYPTLVVLLPPVDDLSDDELGELLGTTRAGAKMLRHRARVIAQGQRRTKVGRPGLASVVRLMEYLGYGQAGPLHLWLGNSAKGTG